MNKICSIPKFVVIVFSPDDHTTISDIFRVVYKYGSSERYDY